MKIFYSAILCLVVFLIIPQIAYADSFIYPIQANTIYLTQTPCLIQGSEDRSHCKNYSDSEAWDLGCGGYSGCGTAVAVADGVVIEAEDNVANPRGYGNRVKILHSDGLVSLYSHLEQRSVAVKIRDKVVQGQELGIIDSSGHSTATHLHFSFSKNGAPYSSGGLIDFSKLNGGIIKQGIVKIYNNIFPQVGGLAVSVKPINVNELFGGQVGQFYEWALGAGSLLALMIIIWSGILYISSAGNSTRQGEAKTWFKAAIYGLILLLCAYLILYVINPCLVGAGTGCG